MYIRKKIPATINTEGVCDRRVYTVGGENDTFSFESLSY